MRALHLAGPHLDKNTLEVSGAVRLCFIVVRPSWSNRFESYGFRKEVSALALATQPAFCSDTFHSKSKIILPHNVGAVVACYFE